MTKAWIPDSFPKPVINNFASLNIDQNAECLSDAVQFKELLVKTAFFLSSIRTGYAQLSNLNKLHFTIILCIIETEIVLLSLFTQYTIS